MKYKATQKEVKAGYRHVIRVPYCALQTLLSERRPVAYTTRVEGWGADVYDFGNVAIVTGYKTFGNIRPDYDTIRSFEFLAESTEEAGEKRKTRFDQLLEEFIRRVTDV